VLVRLACVLSWCASLVFCVGAPRWHCPTCVLLMVGMLAVALHPCSLWWACLPWSLCCPCHLSAPALCAASASVLACRMCVGGLVCACIWQLLFCLRRIWQLLFVCAYANLFAHVPTCLRMANLFTHVATCLRMWQLVCACGNSHSSKRRDQLRLVTYAGAAALSDRLEGRQGRGTCLHTCLHMCLHMCLQSKPS